MIPGPGDRKRTDMVKGKKVNFVHLAPNPLPPFDRVTSVGVVPFTSTGQVVVVRLDRGIDIPGGHVQNGEHNIEEVARREAFEEASITLKDIRPVVVIQSDFYGTAPEDLTYMVTVAAFVDEFRQFRSTAESLERLVLSPEEFIGRYTAGSKGDMRKLVAAAVSVLFGA